MFSRMHKVWPHAGLELRKGHAIAPMEFRRGQAFVPKVLEGEGGVVQGMGGEAAR